MKTMLEYLSQYAFYHQDKRNVATHFIGIPMIVLAITSLLSRPHISLSSIDCTPAILVALASTIFYIKLDFVIGVIMGALLALAISVSEYLASLNTQLWLICSISLFVIGWIFQFIGHYFEGKKPAFVDDITGLIIGPVFVLLEFLFLLGLKPHWQAEIERYCGQKNQEQAPPVNS